MPRNALLFTAALSLLAVAPLTASLVDPFDFSDNLAPGPGLEYVPAGPICFTEGADNDCLEDVSIAAIGAIDDSYSGSETDSYAAELEGEIYQNGVDEGPGSLSGNMETIDTRTSSSQYGGYDSYIEAFDFTGALPVFGSDVEFGLTPGDVSSPPLTTTTIEPSGTGYGITSFFDIFTEISLDGGSSYTPAASQTELDLTATPEPAGASLALLGAAGLLVLARRRGRA